MFKGAAALDSDVVLHLPQGQRYACLQCGRSCRAGWEIPVAPKLEPRLRAYALELRVVGDSAPAFRETPAGTVLRSSREQPGCAFLRDDQLCSVHAELGYASKPTACRHYPFIFTRTPAGVFVGLAFSCSAVQENHGRPLPELELELRELLAEGDLINLVPADGLAVHGSWFTSWDDYAAWELDLLRLAGQKGIAAALRSAAAAVAEDQARRPIYRSPLPRPLSLPPVAATHPWPRALDDALLAEVLPFLGEPCIDGEADGELAPALEAEIERFMEQLVLRKTLLIHPTLLDNLCLLAALPRFLRCAARTTARGAEPEQKDLFEAFDLAEKNLVYHSRALRPLYARVARLAVTHWRESVQPAKVQTALAARPGSGKQHPPEQQRHSERHYTEHEQQGVDQRGKITHLAS